MHFQQQTYHASPPPQQRQHQQQQQHLQQQQQHGFSPNINNIARGQLSPPISSGGRLDVSTSPVNGNSSPSSSMDNRKARRRTGSSKSGILPPTIKRPANAPVTIEGMLSGYIYYLFI